MSYPVYQVPAGDVLPIMFSTYDGGTGASLTMTGLAVTDIEIYKDGSVTQRASDAGYTLLDTDGIDFDGVTGIHGFSIDTGDNTDASFYTVGAWFHVVVSAVTVDAQTVSFIAAAFRLMAAESVAGKPKVDVDAWLGTAAATPTVAGVPEVDVTHWIGTAAATPTTAGVPEVDVTHFGGSAGTFSSGVPAVNATQISGDSTAADNLETAFDDTAGAVPWVGIIDQGTAQSAGPTSLVLRAATPFGSDDACLGATLWAYGSTQGYWQSRLITAYATASDTATVDAWDVQPSGAITYKVFGSAPSAASSAPTAAQIADAVWDEDATGHQTQGTFGQAIGDPAADSKTIYAAVVTDATGASIGIDGAAILADTNELQTDWANGGRLDLLIDGVKAKTDSLAFTVAGQVDANTVSMNDVTVLGAGTSGDKWRG
jgi:hypothetical protein